MTTYSYTKHINDDKLKAEISAASIPSFDHIDTVGDDISIVFSADLNDDNKTSLDNVVAAHDPNKVIVDTALQANIASLISYLNSTTSITVNGAPTTVGNVSRAVIIKNIVPGLAPGVLSTIISQISAIVGS